MTVLIRKIIWNRSRKWNFGIAGMGYLFGVLMIMLSIQVWSDLSHIISVEKGKSELEYLILNKEVAALSTLSAVSEKFKSKFSEKELMDLKSQDLIKDFAAFKTNTFSVSSDLAEKIDMYADLFFESVPDRFIDSVPASWEWNKNSDFLPILMSKEWLNIYNFNVANMYNLPQLSESGASAIEFRVKIGNRLESKFFDAKIIGFSYRFPSLMVPESFMDWANIEYGKGKSETFKVIVAVEEASDPVFLDYLKENRFQANSEKVFSGSIKKIAKVIYLIMSVLGILFTLLALSIFILAVQLIINKSKPQIRLLIDLGYYPSSIFNTLFKFVFRFLVVMIIPLLGLFAVSVFLFHDIVLRPLLDMGFNISIYAIAGMVILFLLTSAINYISIRSTIRTIIK